MKTIISTPKAPAATMEAPGIVYSPALLAINMYVNVILLVDVTLPFTI